MPVPDHSAVLVELEKRRKASNYEGDEDYLSPSVVKNGEQPIAPEMILRRHTRPAFKKLGINNVDRVAFILSWADDDASPKRSRYGDSFGIAPSHQ